MPSDLIKLTASPRAKRGISVPIDWAFPRFNEYSEKQHDDDDNARALHVTSNSVYKKFQFPRAADIST